MKILRVGSGSMVFLAAGVFLMAGCFSKTPNTPQSTQLSAICGAPKYNIVLGKIESSKESVLSRQEFRAVLDKALSESGFNLSSQDSEEGISVEFQASQDYEVRQPRSQKQQQQYSNKGLRS